MGSERPRKRYTPQEYYARERTAPYKSDYHDGEIFAMSGGTWQHSQITTNIVGGLHRLLRGSPCSALDSNMRLKVRATGLRTYPDAAVYCGPLEFDDEDPEATTATNPTVVVEVLSTTTEAYDRGEKFDHYRQIETLKVYVLVSQWAAHVEIFARQPDNSWQLREAKGMNATLTIPTINVELALGEIYERVVFQPRLTMRAD